MQRIAHFLIGLLLTPLVWADSNAVVITLKDEVVVTTPQFTLSDVADIVGENLAENFSDQKLGVTPQPGHLFQLTRFELATRLERQWQGISSRLQIEGSVVKVRGGGVHYDSAFLELAAQTLLEEWLRSQHQTLAGATIGVSRVGKSDSLLVPQGDTQLEARLSPAARLRPRMSVWVDIKVDGKTFQTVPVWFAVSVTTPVRVARHSLEPQRLFTEGDWVFEQRDIAGLGETPVVGNVEPNTWLLRELKAGSVLTARDLGVRPPVREGEQITVVSRHGTVAVAMKGVALANGHLTERIRVENPSSGKSYSAIVMGDGIATVQ